MNNNHFNGPLIIAAILLLTGVGSAQAARIYAGSAETSITPDRPVALEGSFNLRISEGVRSPCMASAVVLESRDGEQVLERSIMVSADLVHLPTKLLNRVRAKVANRIPGVDTSKIFINATHAHTSPVVTEGNFIVPEGIMTIQEYGEFFTQQVMGAIVDAYKSLQPAGVAWGLGHAQVAYNRRAVYFDGHAVMYGPTHDANFKGPEGPEYQGIGAMFFIDESGKPLAAAVNVWCPSQEEEAIQEISADFWGPVRTRLKEKLGPEMVVLGWCGPAGDQSPHRRIQAAAEDRMLRLRGIESWADEFGRRIADSVIETYELVHDDRHDDAQLIHQSETIRLPGWKASEEEIAEIRKTHDDLAEELAKHPEKAAKLGRQISRRAETLALHDRLARSPDGCYPTEIHVLRIGDVAVCTNQFELFTEYGLRILARSDAHLTFVVQLAGPAFYLPTAEAVRGGGYGATTLNCAVGPEGGQVLVDETVARISALWKDDE